VDWSATAGRERDIDLLFSGRLVAVKNAGFALQMAQGVAQQLARPVRLALLGSGPLEAELRAQAATLAPQVDVLFAGHVAQSEIPAWFQRARLFVFPTRWDPWGVVANEACLAGVPVLVSPFAGVAGELVRDGINGRVLPLELPAWVQTANRPCKA
jgi:glycosyltransferase involved in cell wall biosynthesis